MLKDFEYQWRPYYLIFKTATLKVKLPVGFPKKQMAQFWVASVPLTPRVTVYCHPIRSSDQIEMIMYSVTLICKSYACFSDFAVMVLVKNSIPGRLLFYWALKYFHLLQFSVPPFRRIAILSAENEKAIIASKLLEPNFIRMTVTALAPPRSSGRLVLPAIAEKIIFSGGLSRSYIPPAGRLLFYKDPITPYSRCLRSGICFRTIC